MSKQDILNSLTKFVNQRPGLPFADYGDAAIYRRDYRQHCQQPKQDFEVLVRAVEWRDSLFAGDIREGFKRAFGGRLSLLDDETLDYTPGQHGALEYRRAACAVLASVLWDYWREDTPENMTPREHITRTARREFGRGIAGRYFD